MRNTKKIPAVVRLSSDVAPTVVKAADDAGRSFAEEIRLRLLYCYTHISEDALRSWNANRTTTLRPTK